MTENLEQILAKAGLNPDESLKWNRNKDEGMQALRESKSIYFVNFLVQVSV